MEDSPLFIQNSGAAEDDEGEEADLVVVAVLVLTAASGGSVEEESCSGWRILDGGSSLFFSLFSYVFLFSLFLFSCFYISSSVFDDGGATVDGVVIGANGGRLGS
jgi:hypothetical protein